MREQLINAAVEAIVTALKAVGGGQRADLLEEIVSRAVDQDDGLNNPYVELEEALNDLEEDSDPEPLETVLREIRRALKAGDLEGVEILIHREIGG